MAEAPYSFGHEDLSVNRAGFTESARRWLEAGLSFLYPPACQLCAQARSTPANGYVCEDCRAQVRFIERPFCERCGLPYEGEITTRFECGNCREADLHFRSARSAVVARDKVLEVIHRYKYHRALWFEPFLADLLLRRAAAELAQQKWDLIVPIPLHSSRYREREFNQAERLAVRLGEVAHIPVESRLLARVLPTRTQTQLSRDERLANVRNAFAFRKSGRLSGQSIVLVDDVFTTGATANACAKVLKSAGAGEVSVWTVARGI